MQSRSLAPRVAAERYRIASELHRTLNKQRKMTDLDKSCYTEELGEAIEAVVKSVAKLKMLEYPMIIQASLTKEEDYDFYEIRPNTFLPEKIKFVKDNLYPFNFSLAPIVLGYRHEKVRENSSLG